MQKDKYTNMDGYFINLQNKVQNVYLQMDFTEKEKKIFTDFPFFFIKWLPETLITPLFVPLFYLVEFFSKILQQLGLVQASVTKCWL